jgi:formate hydrogenlyase transcriptional activator
MIQPLSPNCKHVRLLGEIFVSALQRRDANEALSLAKESLDLAAASANAGLWALDPDTGLIWSTDKAREMFGYDPATELTLEMLLADIHEDDRALIEIAVDVALYTGKEINVEYRMPSVDGQVRWLNSRGCVQGKCLMGVTIDVTNHKQVERQLQ